VITGIPAADDFTSRAKSLLNLAWEVTLSLQRHHLRAMDSYAEVRERASDIWSPEEIQRQTENYWGLCQPELQNAQALIHQAVEMALKGRICSVSPYLLIARDARDYPSQSHKKDVPFSSFRTIDAADLLRVADSVCLTRLDECFENLWAAIREERNVNMHSLGGRGSLMPVSHIRHILQIHQLLFPGEPWMAERSGYRIRSHRDTAYEIDYYDFSTSICLNELDAVIGLLTPTECLEHFRFRKKDRRYLCPVCDQGANKHEHGQLPHLAQLKSRNPGETGLYCCACGANTTVYREPCRREGCNGNAKSEWPDSQGQCLTCEAWPGDE
jgi:hypothetical protein